VPRR
jgi:hypothetical protein